MTQAEINYTDWLETVGFSDSYWSLLEYSKVRPNDIDELTSLGYGEMN